jgi:deoxyribodipyrimidine photolyase-related protein
MTKLCVILGDQISHNISSLKWINKTQDEILMMEVMDESQYVKHHPKKIAFILSTMRHFASELEQQGYRVNYIKLDSQDSYPSFCETLINFIQSRQFDEIVVTEPSEYRVKQLVAHWHQKTRLPVTLKQDDRFICSNAQFKQWAGNKKQLLMENFYRQMRKKTGFLMQSGQPVGGKWNYDKDNRKVPKSKQNYPTPLKFKPDKITQEVLKLVKKHFNHHFGDLDVFWFATNRNQEKLSSNHRLAFAYRNLQRFSDEKIQTIQKDTKNFIEITYQSE